MDSSAMSNDTDPDGATIRPAHPAFAAHFTRAVYDPDAEAFGDDVPPFGSDEGWDQVFEWAERADELAAHPTLRFMIEANDMSADEFVAELAATEQVDVDDILIGMGFTLLRYTGQIDPEGRGWLEQALTRQRDRDATVDEYDMLLSDLRSF